MRRILALSCLFVACDKTPSTSSAPSASSAAMPPPVTSALRASIANQPVSFTTALAAKRSGEAVYVVLSNHARGCDDFPSPNSVRYFPDEKFVILTIAPLLWDVVEYAPRVPSSVTWRVTSAQWQNGHEAPASGSAELGSDIAAKGGEIRLSYRGTSELFGPESIALEGAIRVTGCGDRGPKLPPPLLVAKVGGRDVPLRGATIDADADGWQTLVLSSLPRDCGEPPLDQANDLVLRIRSKGDTQAVNASGARVPGNLAWPTHFAIRTGGPKLTLDGDDAKGSLALHGTTDVVRCSRVP